MWGAGGGPCPPRGDKATTRHSSGSLQENHTSHHNTQGCIPQNHSAEGLQPYGGCDVRGGEVLAPSVEGPRSQTPPVGKRGCAGGLCSLPAPSGEGGSSWAAPSPWAPRVWGRGLRWGGEKGFPPVRPPGSRAECECLPAAFLIACSMAGVIQRRAEASAATETTMKRKRSSKKFSVHKSAELQVIPGQGRAKEKRRLEAAGQNVPTRTLGWG